MVGDEKAPQRTGHEYIAAAIWISLALFVLGMIYVMGG